MKKITRLNISLLLAGIALCLLNCQREECQMIPGLDAFLVPGQVILVGEMHGTREAPAFVDHMVCNGLSKGLSVTVGLEWPQPNQAEVIKYLQSKGATADREELFGLSFWNYEDGRASQAMFELLESLRIRMSKNEKVELILIDNHAVSDRDKEMATHILSAVERHPDDFVVVLTGNVHNEINKGSGRMGDYVLQALGPEKVVSLNQSFAGGSAWVCLMEGCGPVNLRGSGVRGIGIELEEYPGTYHGLLKVDSIHASAPAKDLLK